MSEAAPVKKEEGVERMVVDATDMIRGRFEGEKHIPAGERVLHDTVFPDVMKEEL